MLDRSDLRPNSGGPLPAPKVETESGGNPPQTPPHRRVLKRSLTKPRGSLAKEDP